MFSKNQSKATVILCTFENIDNAVPKVMSRFDSNEQMQTAARKKSNKIIIIIINAQVLPCGGIRVARDSFHAVDEEAREALVRPTEDFPHRWTWGPRDLPTGWKSSSILIISGSKSQSRKKNAAGLTQTSQLSHHLPELSSGGSSCPIG